jgi:hypothetical protein
MDSQPHERRRARLNPMQWGKAGAHDDERKCETTPFIGDKRLNDLKPKEERRTTPLEHQGNQANQPARTGWAGGSGRSRAWLVADA